MDDLPASPYSPVPYTPPPSQVEAHTFAFVGSGAAFFALVIKNMLLTVVTLGVYLPWAKTERRQYLWQNIEIAGHRLRYHGTGKELFFGYLKVVIAYAVFLGLRLLGDRLGPLLQVVMILALIPALPFVIWGSRRYLLSRTSWRGVRFRLQGDVKRFAVVMLVGYLFTIFSFGLFGPVWINRMHAILTNATALGTRHFVYRGDDSTVFKLLLKSLPWIILSFGIYLFWYQAKLLRYQTENTYFDGARGELELTGGELLQLTLLQILALTCSLGLAFPWITTYTLRFYLARMRFLGPIQFAEIQRAESQGSATADGFADVLDVGVVL